MSVSIAQSHKRQSRIVNTVNSMNYMISSLLRVYLNLDKRLRKQEIIFYEDKRILSS